MAICIEFELVEIQGTAAVYKYGSCLQELEGLFEVDLPKLISGQIAMSAPMNEVVKLLNDKQGNYMAYKAFGKIFRHFKASGEYLTKGGYYA